MRRQPLTIFSYEGGYVDSLQPLSGNTNTYAEGSANSFVLGEGAVRPFKGYVNKGPDSGSRIAVQLGSTYGGLRSYSSVTASGSFIKDLDEQLYAIGSGRLMYETTPVVKPNSSFNLASNSDINTTTNVITKVGHGLATGDAIRISAATTMPTVSGTALSSTTTYYAIYLSVDTFRMAYTYAQSLAGTAVDFTSQGTGTITFYTSTILTASTVLTIASIPINNTWYTYYDQAGLDQPEAPSTTVPTTPGTGYTGLMSGAIAFKLGAMRDRAQAGVDITDVNIAVKSIASTTSVVSVPNNQTVKIQFPTAQSGQTHWAVFASKQGFGASGVFLRIGYRTSSDAGAVWYWGISETTVAAATNRTLEFDFQDGDLYPEEAWIFDYQPPPGTHFLRLDSCGVVLGCYDGTVAAVSLPNFLESYHPRHLLYFPEPVTAVLHRQTDDFAYIAGRNSIHAIQYVGYRGDDLPCATVTTISPDVGIVNQCNWAQAEGSIIAFLEGKGLVRIFAGGTERVEIDYEFGREVAWLTKDWDTTTVVAWNPSTQSVIAGNGAVSVSYCFESKVWGSPVYNTDAGMVDISLTDATVDATGVTVTTSSTTPFTANMVGCVITATGSNLLTPYTGIIAAYNSSSSITVYAAMSLDIATSSPLSTCNITQTSSWLSAVSSRGEMIANFTQGTSVLAYTYDSNTNTTRMPVVTISRWASQTGGARSNNIYEVETAIRQGTNAEPLMMGVHTNLFKTYLRTVSMTASSATITASSSVFNDSYTGKAVALFGQGLGNKTFTASAGTDLLTVTSTTGMYTGQAVTVSNSGGALPTGLAASTTYYAIIASSTTLYLATTLRRAMSGTYIDITGAGSGTNTIVINYLTGYITYASATTVTLADISGSAINASTSVSGMLMLIGQYFAPVTPQVSLEEHLVNIRPAVQNARSFCISQWQATDAATNAVFLSTVFGTESQSSVVNTSF